MTSISLTDSSADIAPVQSSERIQALDVVRGFALIGIFLMNIEFFNRPLQALGQGLPTTLTGLDWLAGWVIYTFVQGKFWTMFSLLFGMGFAVMLTRAERADRNFLRPYLRRIAALALFGALHFVFIWGGDILFSYAVGAVGLLLLLYGNWLAMVFALAVLVGLGFVPSFEPAWQVAGGLGFVLVCSLFLRGEWKASLRGRVLPVFSLVFLILGAVLALVALALWLAPGAPADPRIPATIMSMVLIAIGLLSARYHDPIEPRQRRLGVAMYLFPFLMMTMFGAVQYLAPEPETAAAAANAPAIVKPATPVGLTAGQARKAAAPAQKSDAEQRAERKAERATEQRKQLRDIEDERQLLTHGSYADVVRMRAGDFVEHAPGQAGFAMVIIGMFLLGSWFVRSGVMENTGAHLALFRKLALFGLPLGLGLGLLGSAIATSATPGLEHDPYQIAMGLTMIGNLPACLAYVSLIVLMLHSGGALARIKVLAPLGRMALTNYLTHSVVGTLFFYGYGLGNWGMGRAMQVVFVAIVISLQVLFCHWWLARFRYGPMEWVWRAITYWQLPPMRREASVLADARHASV